jgi:hypothetical protein
VIGGPRGGALCDQWSLLQEDRSTDSYTDGNRRRQLQRLILERTSVQTATGIDTGEDK